MSGPFDLLAASRYSHDAGTAATVTAAGAVWAVSCHSTAGGTLTITPGGANQTTTALSVITIPPGTGFQAFYAGSISKGSVFVFSGTDAYYVQYMLSVTGA